MTKHVDFKHISAYSGPEESLGYLLWRISTEWRSSIEATLRPLNLTHPQFVVLAATAWLTRNGQMVSQIQIGKMAGLDPNTISQILRGLETKEFIVRKRSIDERGKNPVLTNSGSQVLAIAMPAVEKADAEFFSILSFDESADLLKIFQKLSALKTST